jgi:hypothetical protein
MDRPLRPFRVAFSRTQRDGTPRWVRTLDRVTLWHGEIDAESASSWAAARGRPGSQGR